MNRLDVWLRVLTVRLTGLGPNATFSGSLPVKVSTQRCPVADEDVVRSEMVRSRKTVYNVYY
jgi:hypothetical protein